MYNICIKIEGKISGVLDESRLSAAKICRIANNTSSLHSFFSEVLAVEVKGDHKPQYSSQQDWILKWLFLVVISLSSLLCSCPVHFSSSSSSSSFIDFVILLPLLSPNEEYHNVQSGP